MRARAVRRSDIVFWAFLVTATLLFLAVIPMVIFYEVAIIVARALKK